MIEVVEVTWEQAVTYLEWRPLIFFFLPITLISPSTSNPLLKFPMHAESGLELKKCELSVLNSSFRISSDKNLGICPFCRILSAVKVFLKLILKVTLKVTLMFFQVFFQTCTVSNNYIHDKLVCNTLISIVLTL